MDLEQEYTKLIKDLDDILSFGRDGLLKSEKMYGTIYAAEDKLKEISLSLDERSRLSIEKIIPMWRNVPKIGILVRNEEVEKRVIPLRALLTELLSKATGKFTVNLKQELVITADKPYEGRLYLRNLFQQAGQSIFIRDSYFRPVILDVLLEFMSDNNKLKVEILMGDNSRLAPFKVSFLAFKQQYTTLDISARYSSSADNDHPRYIFIDDQLLFNPDHSLDQWGVTTVNIHQLIETSEIAKVKLLLLEDWQRATNII
jgi:hypothetical protein